MININGLCIIKDDMNIFKGMGSFFALDIGTKALRVAQLVNAGNGRYNLEKIGYLSVDQKVIAGSSEEATKKLGDAILQVVNSAGINTRQCVVGLDSTKTFTTVIDIPKMSSQDLRATLKYQADKYLPMPLDNVRYDWSVLGDSPSDPQKYELLLASVPQDYVEHMVEMVDSLGLNVIGAEPDSIALVRSMLSDNEQGVSMVLDIGENSTNLVVTINGSPRLVRTLQMGFESLVKTIAQGISVKEDQASQFLIKFGIDEKRLDGQIYTAATPVIDAFVAEINKSIVFFQNKYSNANVANIYVTGYGSKIPKMIDYMKKDIKSNVQSRSPWAKVNVPQDKMQSIMPVESEFATVLGLAQRVVK